MHKESTIVPIYISQKSSAISFRRWHLDAFLEGIPWNGNVLDIGGRKGIYRGTFRPPFDRVASWEYVNINPATNPDYLASADALPLTAETKDITLLSETLEHLAYPEKALAEAHRVLVSGGSCYLLAPFLHPLHGDPEDYQRWLPQKYTDVLSEIGFSKISICPMGGIFSVVHDLFLVMCNNEAAKGKTRPVKIRNHILPFFAKFCTWADKKNINIHNYITTGYFVHAIK